MRDYQYNMAGLEVVCADQCTFTITKCTLIVPGVSIYLVSTCIITKLQ